ncbi:hypothetical protein VMT65_38110 [Nocardia sp. CDC153]|uniref:hypothetical protein n=1 Tax=Nocardia sp. CDC153 TaxID=3112167 RepID=UPI002DB6B541|nr:hypothetical protein [Nocardia sp. CDC153]MEC3958901.1 hypothetical protein [Nocardia sp. CDC153]
MNDDPRTEEQAEEPVPRSRLFSFPGGFLELQATGSEDDNHCGFYLEIHGHIALDGHDDQGAEMRYKPTALGYLRTDVSGIGQQWDESEIRSLAKRYGYDFADMVIYDPNSDRPPLARLKAQATRLDAEAVFVPSLKHFDDGEPPGSLVQKLDVVTVHPEQTYARRAMPLLQDLPPVKADGA